MRPTIVAIVIALCCAVTSLFAASAGEMRYRVTISDTEIASVNDVAASLVATYGGEVDSSDAAGPHSFVILTTPERAKLMLGSRSIARIEPMGAGAHSSRMATNTQVDLGTYSYDGSGNIRFIGTDVYQYDKVGRLGSAASPSVTQSYTYDGFGNLSALATSQGVLCAGNVDCGRTLAISSQTNHITSNSAHYTDAGNLDAIDGYTFTYDDLGMMTQQRIGASIVRQFVYTADDERIATYLPAGTWNWTVRDLSGAVLRTFTSQNSGTVLGTANWQWGEDYIYRGSLLLATKDPQGVRHLHLDHLGTPRLVTDDAGHQLGIHKYLPFGAEQNIGSRETPEEARKFTGHERDGLNNASTLDYMHARYYGWGTGRFLSVDPAMDVKRAMVRPQTWNRYEYAANNPLSIIDRNGRGDTDLRCNPYTECKTPEMRAAFEEGKDTVWKVGVAAAVTAAVVIYAPPLARLLFSWGITHPNEATQVASDIVLPPGPNPFIPGPVNSQFGKLDYLLGEVPSDKSRALGGFFKGELGFSKAAEGLLDSALRNQFAANFRGAVVNEKGLYEVTGQIAGANGRTAVIRTVWEKIAEDTYKLVTAVPSH